MTENVEERELKERLSLIATMIAEGRRSTESWGWVFVLWGAAYYIAMAWSSGLFTGPIWAQHYLAWPITMIGACILTVVLAARNHGDRPPTTIGRAIGAIWMAMGISMFALLLPLGLSGRGNQQVVVAAICAMLGSTNAASSIIVKFKAQFACAVVWWAAAAASCFGSESQSAIAFMVAIFFCQIVFGAYGMILESRVRKQEAAHA
jgi:hypothetical protein